MEERWRKIKEEEKEEKEKEKERERKRGPGNIEKIQRGDDVALDVATLA